MFCIVIEEKATGKSLVEGEFETKEEAEAVLEERKTYYNTPIVLREMFGLNETPCALAARGFFVLSVLLFFMEFILMWRVYSCPKLLLDAYISLMSPMIGSGSVLQCAAL